MVYMASIASQSTKQVAVSNHVSGNVTVEAKTPEYRLFQLENGQSDTMYLKIYEDKTFDLIRQLLGVYTGSAPEVESYFMAVGKVIEEYGGDGDTYIGHTLDDETIIIEIGAAEEGKPKAFVIRTFGAAPAPKQ
jgi:hypothetical protein